MKKMSEYDKILFISECRNDLMHSYKLSKYDSILILFDDHYTGITDRYMDLYNILRNISTTVNITMVFVRNDLGIFMHVDDGVNEIEATEDSPKPKKRPAVCLLEIWYM